MDSGVRSTAIAAFASQDDAQRAIRGLLEVGFGRDRLNLVMREIAASTGGTAGGEPTTACNARMFRSLVGEETPEAEIRSTRRTSRMAVH
jgi:hypothetical protein